MMFSLSYVLRSSSYLFTPFAKGKRLANMISDTTLNIQGSLMMEMGSNSQHSDNNLTTSRNKRSK